MTAAPVFLSHPSSLAHDTGSHPEQPARITAIERELSERQWLGYERIESPPIERTTLEAVHPPGYVDSIESAAAAGGASLDPDTVVSEGSFDAALHSAGGAVRLVDLLLDGDAPTGFSCHRPPGHHALAARAMGFCLFNSAAVVAQHALTVRGLERVMVVDWDVHHGNGTNDIFHSSAAVLYASIHQSPLYPGTGAASDVGTAPGEGFTVNMPVPPGSGDSVFSALVDQVVVPLARAFKPQLVLLSAGYDAHRDDPLADCAVTEPGYAAMTASLKQVCAELDAPLAVVLEGGYALGPLARSVATTLKVLAGISEPDGVPPPPHPLAEQARRRLSEWWSL